MRGLLALLIGLTICLSTGVDARAEKRVALVIGNSAYRTVAALPNPANDADAVGRLLKSSGFDTVVFRRDLGVAEFRRAVRDFADAVRDADIAVVFYAGHGIEIDGANYLIPVDSRLDRDVDVDDETVSLDRLLKIIEPAKRLRLVILDACRDNPFANKMKRSVATRAVGRGLARIEPDTANTLIAFAAKAGSTALDGDSTHSPFTAAVLKYIARPGLDVRIAFGLIRDEVLKNTGSQQEPFVYGSLGGALVSLVPEPARAEAKPIPPPSSSNAEERADYELAERVGTMEAWDYFLAAHASGFYANLAKAQRAKLSAAKGAAPAVVLPVSPATQRPDTQPLPAQSPPPQVAASPVVAAVPLAVEPATRSAPEAPADKIAPEAIAGLLQINLKRVGCDPGTTNGKWDGGSRRALQNYNKYAGTKLGVETASLAALEAVQSTTSRVCPLMCEHGSRAEGEECVPIKCDAGHFLAGNNSCEPIRPRPKTVVRQAPERPRSGGRCVSFGGRQVCE